MGGGRFGGRILEARKLRDVFSCSCGWKGTEVEARRVEGGEPACPQCWKGLETAEKPAQMALI